MGDLAVDTSLSPLTDGRFTATLSRDWEIWGPNGGYMAAIAHGAAREPGRGPSDRGIDPSCGQPSDGIAIVAGRHLQPECMGRRAARPPMSELEGLGTRARGLVDRHDSMLRELGRIDYELHADAEAPSSTSGKPNDPLIAAERTRLDRAVAVARRRQLVRLMPWRGRVALLRRISRRLLAGSPRSPLAPTVHEPAREALHSPRDVEAALGEELGHLVLLRTELARAQQDVLAPRVTPSLPVA